MARMLRHRTPGWKVEIFWSRSGRVLLQDHICRCQDVQGLQGELRAYNVAHLRQYPLGCLTVRLHSVCIRLGVRSSSTIVRSDVLAAPE